MSRVLILNVDVMAGLAQLPDESQHMVVTSPPYWGLRSYLPKDHPDKPREIGQETRLDCLGWARSENCGKCYICVLRNVFSEVHRVLRSDGTLWVNQGDSYHNGDKGGYERSTTGKQSTNTGTIKGLTANRLWQDGLKPKDLCGQPWRIAFALQADGWWWRDEIIWHKKSCMPSSQRDRCTRSHEVVLMFSKSKRYYYDIEAVKEPVSQSILQQIKQGYAGHTTKDFEEAGTQDASATKSRIIAGARASWRGSTFDAGKTGEMKRTRGGKIKVPSGWETGKGAHGAFHSDGRAQTPEYREIKPPHDSIEARKARARDWNKSMPTDERAGIRPSRSGNKARKYGSDRDRPDSHLGASVPWEGFTRTKRSVWSLGPEPFCGQHYATYPTALVEPMILAGTSEKGVCPECGAPWVRVVDAEFVSQQDVSEEKGVRGAGAQKPLDESDGRDGFPRGATASTTTGWRPECQHYPRTQEWREYVRPKDDLNPTPEEVTENERIAELRAKLLALWHPLVTAPATVLDPFAGACTTGLVAARLQRNATLIELNHEYAEMGLRRIVADAPLLADIRALTSSPA